MEDHRLHATPVGASAPAGVSPPIDDQCAWVALHAKGWQEGEAGVIEAIAAHLEPHLPEETRWCVEFGAGDGDSLPLTVAGIIDCDGWRALLIEPNRTYYRRLCGKVPPSAVVVQNSVALAGENTIDGLMRTYGCPPNPAVMVVDIDSIEYHIVAEMKSRPVVLCVETMDRNSPRQTDAVYIPGVAECGTIVEDGFDTQLQANGAAFDVLMGGRGYALVYRTRFNSIYVRGDMVPRLRKSKVNLGCGDNNIRGYEPVDVRVNGKDVRKLDLPDGSQDETYASHVLEHLPIADVAETLAEWVRVLKPGGTLRIAVPDVRKIGAELAKPDLDNGQAMYALSMLYGSQNYAENFHKWGYTEATLRGLMHGAGVGFIQPFRPFMEDCSANPFSLNLEGVKRWWPKVEKPKVALVMSQPEIAHTGHEMALMEMVKALTLKGVDLKFVPPKGAFWDRDITIGTQVAIDLHEPDFLLYSDYDSQFEADDILRLLDAINGDPTMAAIGSVQMSRHDDLPLVMEAHNAYEGDVSRVRFQHFGLTLVRRPVFEEMPQPWFMSVPGKDANGDWDWQGWGRSDADITFWRNMDMLGFRVCQHNKVIVGHNIRAIKYPGDTKSGVIIWPIENYRRKGKPLQAVFAPERYRERLNKKHGITSKTVSPPGAGGGEGSRPPCPSFREEGD